MLKGLPTSVEILSLDSSAYTASYVMLAVDFGIGL